MKARRLFAVMAIALGAAASAMPAQPVERPMEKAARMEDWRALGVGRLVADMELVPLKGEKCTVGSLLKDRKALVVAMTSVTCPLSGKYAPRLATMEDEYRVRGVAFVYVNGVEAETVSEMNRQAHKNRFEGHYLADRERALAKALGARTTTEVFVLDAARTLVYRGAVDDQYAVGAALDAPRQRFLKDALESVLSGERVRVKATWAPGCLVDLPPLPEDGAPVEGEVTYYARLSRVLAENCVSCHRPGGTAPFGLDTYGSVQGRAAMIEAVVRDGLMPPWHGARPSPGEVSPWANDRSMSDADRTVLLDWLKSGMAEGNAADAPLAPKSPGTWNIGLPDLLVSTPGEKLPPGGPMLHARVTVAMNLTTDKWATAIELRPVERESVHHALVWILDPGTPLPEPSAMPTGLELLATYSPADGILKYPAGAARKIRAGSMLLVDLYAQPMGREMVSSLRVAFKFGNEPAQRVRTVAVSAPTLEFKQGQGRVDHSVEWTAPEDSRVLAITPYARSRGREVFVDAVATDGQTQNWLSAPRYDYRWPIRYEFLEPRRTASGTRLALRGVYDVSVDAASGAEPVLSAGVGPTDEALMLAVEVLEAVSTPARPGAGGGRDDRPRE